MGNAELKLWVLKVPGRSSATKSHTLVPLLEDSLKVYFILSRVHLCFWVSATWVWLPLKGRSSYLIPWKWSDRWLLSPYVGTGSWTRVFWKTSKYLNCWAISLALPSKSISSLVSYILIHCLHFPSTQNTLLFTLWLPDRVSRRDLLCCLLEVVWAPLLLLLFYLLKIAQFIWNVKWHFENQSWNPWYYLGFPFLCCCFCLDRDVRSTGVQLVMSVCCSLWIIHMLDWWHTSLYLGWEYCI